MISINIAYFESDRVVNDIESPLCGDEVVVANAADDGIVSFG